MLITSGEPRTIVRPRQRLLETRLRALARSEYPRRARFKEFAIVRFREDQPGDEMTARIFLPKKRASEERDPEAGTSDNFDLAYAITVHKSQGSESPCIIVMADPAAGMVADRNHWYTSISRAAKLCLVIGQRSVVDRQCAKVGLMKRQTFLQELLREVRS